VFPKRNPVKVAQRFYSVLAKLDHSHALEAKGCFAIYLGRALTLEHRPHGGEQIGTFFQVLPMSP
jgi:hypothetical protein